MLLPMFMRKLGLSKLPEVGGMVRWVRDADGSGLEGSLLLEENGEVYLEILESLDGAPRASVFKEKMLLEDGRLRFMDEMEGPSRVDFFAEAIRDAAFLN